MDKMLFAVLIICGVIFCAIYTFNIFIRNYRHRRYGRISSFIFFKRHIEKLYLFLSKNKTLVSINDETAYKFSMFNSFSVEKNKYLSAAALVIWTAAVLILSSVLIICYSHYWYAVFAYIIISHALFLFAMQILTEIIMRVYLKRMRDAVKIILSRFMTKGSISKAIHSSIPDIPSGIRSDMIRIYGALKLNEAVKTKCVLREIDRKYRSGYVSVFLELIYIAHYGGASDAVKSQFFAILNDISLLKTINQRRIMHTKEQELKLLKIIFFLNACIKPEDHAEAINAIYEKAIHYKNDIENIMAVIDKSNVDKEDFFARLLQETNDIDAKLFYEMLCMCLLNGVEFALKPLSYPQLFVDNRGLSVDFSV